MAVKVYKPLVVEDYVIPDFVQQDIEELLAYYNAGCPAPYRADIYEENLRADLHACLNSGLRQDEINELVWYYCNGGMFENALKQ